jgi:hypothetical protein
MRISIIQSNYIPWIGYFNLISLSDATVILDSVQFTKNDWRNRNTISRSGSPQWLTIPISTSGSALQRINEAQVLNGRWAIKHWRTIKQVLGKNPHFGMFGSSWELLYQKAENLPYLHDINLLFLDQMIRDLDVATPLIDDRIVESDDSTPTVRLVSLCKSLGATKYLTGPSALNYLSVDAFAEAEISLEIMNYDPIVEQTRLLGVNPRFSIIETLSCLGPKTRELLVGVPEIYTVR